ncbi:MAG: LuxR C-terminal-related transcriptional regulator [Candidatus Acidiferrum sp.]
MTVSVQNVSAQQFAESSRLTARELEVIRLLFSGKSSKQISGSLQISARTVDTHRANIMRKLNLHSVTEVLHFVISNKILTSETEPEAALPQFNKHTSPTI